MGSFHKTESEIWDGFGALGSLELMNFLYFFKTILSSILFRLIKGDKSDVGNL